MGRVTWKEDKVISIETENNIFVLAQMLCSPYLLIFDTFSEGNIWDKSYDLSGTKTLLCKAVTRQFLSESNIRTEKIKHRDNPKIEKYWISMYPESFSTTIFEGTSDETVINLFGEGGGSLIEVDIYDSGYEDEKIILDPIPFDHECIDKYETTDIEIYPNFNQRLYLSYKYGRVIDPIKDVIFHRPLLDDYKAYFGIGV